MQKQMLDQDTKAIVIEIADIFYEMDVEEIPENYPQDREFSFHMKVIRAVLKKAKAEGYTKYAVYSREEAKARKQDLGLNGMYLVVVKK